jgi:exodeoxyribonuclease V gamma subunit
LLTLYRGNRAELLAELLAITLRLDPPGPFEQVRVVVNTWPTSRWLGEQLALGLDDPDTASDFAGGIAANLRFPFPGSYLRELVDALLAEGELEEGEPPARGADPWRATALVWPLLEQLPALIEAPEAQLLRNWLTRRGHGGSLAQLDRSLWQLARAIADAFDDYALYRPDMLAAWSAGQFVDGIGKPLQPLQHWQPLLYRLLAARLPQPPFALRVRRAIELLRQRLEAGAGQDLAALPISGPIRLFGLSSMAPLQVELLQALSGLVDVEIYLLSPCRELWRRRAEAAQTPLGEDWLLQVPRLEARFGRLGAEFQQLLEGTGVAQLGAWQERDLFLGSATAAEHAGRPASLLEQLQQQLVEPESWPLLNCQPGDRSLLFVACPGRLRQVQIVRDQILQLMAADPSLAPRDVLVMTPQVDLFAPLVAAVFGDGEATGVHLPWRLTDRSQQSEPGIVQGLLALLELAGERLTASSLERLLACPPLLARHGIEADEAAAITALLQRAGFRWGLDGGLDGSDRGGNPCHSLSWVIDRLLLGLVLPEQPGLAPAETAPLAMAGNLEQQGRWLQLLLGLRRALRQLQRPRPAAAWLPLLRELIERLFGDGGARAWELPPIHAALAEWGELAGDCELCLPVAVVAAVLQEQLAVDSGRFGHRSGALTISGLEPMRAIPHRLIVLMGLDAGVFPRQRQRPGFHLMERQRQLGDPDPADQDRYVLLESLLSARQHLLITWNSRDPRSGDQLMPCTPVRQWLALLEQDLGDGALEQVLRQPAANPLERRNFLPDGPWPPISSDRRLLAARRLLEQQGTAAPRPLVDPAGPAEWPAAPIEAAAPIQSAADTTSDTAAETLAFGDLLAWWQAPQRHWLAGLGLRPRESSQPIEDLEPFNLEERQRSQLLRNALEAGECPDLHRELRGRGLLPAGSAGLLEAQRLSQRWFSLDQLLASLGEERRQLARGQGLTAELLWRGDALLLVHPAKPRTPQRLQLWLELLLACVAGQAPRRALLVGRQDQDFAVLESLQPLEPKAAAPLLDQLQSWRHHYRERCWPVPPETGWAWAGAEAKQPGRGPQAACQAWEGGFGAIAERQAAEMALCFGPSLPAHELVSERFVEHARALYGPILARHAKESRR